MRGKKQWPLIIGMVALLTASGCTAMGVAAGAGASVGIAAAQEGGLRNAANDAAIRLEINDLWFKKDLDMFRKVNLTVMEGRVLLTGIVENPDHRVEAVRLAWQAKNVTQVLNEIQVRDDYSWQKIGEDKWLATKLRTQITFDKNVQSINYSIDVVDGIVYLLGVGQDQKEIDLVIQHARNTAGVKQVVSYVRLRGDTPPNLKTPESASDEL